MKKIGLLLLMLISLDTFSQDESSRLSLYVNTLQSPGFSAYAFSPLLEVGVSETVNLRYSLGFGVNQNNKLYLHSPLTLPLGTILFFSGLGDNTNIISTLGIILIVIPEGVSFDIPVTDKLEISPFIDVNAGEFFLKTNNEFDFSLSGDAGASVQYSITDHFYGCSYISAGYMQSHGISINGGFGVGFRFN